MVLRLLQITAKPKVELKFQLFEEVVGLYMTISNQGMIHLGGKQEVGKLQALWQLQLGEAKFLALPSKAMDFGREASSDASRKKEEF